MHRSFDNHPLTEAERKRGMLVLMVSTFFTWGGFYLVVPLVGVHYVDQLGWAAASIGIVLAVRQFVQQGATAVSGALADKTGAKGPIVVGLLIRAVGFAALAWSTTFPILLAAFIIAALGGALFDSPKNAAIASLTTEEERPRFYSLSGVFIGLGMAVGTQAGAMLLKVSFEAVAIAAGLLYVLIAIMAVILLPPVKVADDDGDFWTGFRLAARDKAFVIFIVLMAGQWFMSTQFFLTMPLAATAITGKVETVAIITGINSAIAVVLGYPLPRFVVARIGAERSLIVGVAITACGLLVIGFARNLEMLIAGVALFSVGITLVRPSEQTVAARLANRKALGSYFGLAALSVAVGGGLGNIAGGYLYDIGEQTGVPALPWLVCAGIGALTALGLWVSNHARLRHASEVIRSV